MDKARLRENARILRTIQGELAALYKVQRERFIADMKMGRTPKDDPDDEASRIRGAEAAVLGNLTKAFLELTEQLAGDIDQDLRPT